MTKSFPNFFFFNFLFFFFLPAKAVPKFTQPHFPANILPIQKRVSFFRWTHHHMLKSRQNPPPASHQAELFVTLPNSLPREWGKVPGSKLGRTHCICLPAGCSRRSSTCQGLQGATSLPRQGLHSTLTVALHLLPPLPWPHFERWWI